jgi:hypothetical protein
LPAVDPCTVAACTCDVRLKLAGRPRARKAASQFARRAVGFGPLLMLRASHGSVAVMKEVACGRKSSVIAGARNDWLFCARMRRSSIGYQRRP